MCAWQPVNKGQNEHPEQITQAEQSPLPFGLSLIKPPEPKIYQDTVTLLKYLLEQAERGEVTGLALASLHSDTTFQLRLSGEASESGSQMGVIGMLTCLQKMAVDLH
jgi:hypothetical protein